MCVLKLGLVVRPAHVCAQVWASMSLLMCVLKLGLVVRPTHVCAQVGLVCPLMCVLKLGLVVRPTYVCPQVWASGEAYSCVCSSLG